MFKSEFFGQAFQQQKNPHQGPELFSVGVQENSLSIKRISSLVSILLLALSFSALGPAVCFAQSASNEGQSNNSGGTVSSGPVSATSPSANSTNTSSNAAQATPLTSSGATNPSNTSTTTGVSPGQLGSKSEPASQDASKVAKPNLSASSPKWSELTAKQQLALRPLFDLWGEMSEIQKRKWLALSANFSDLDSKDQEKMQARMTQWSVLSPQQRAQARVIYAQVQQYQGDERLNKWQEYQALDPEKKSQLAQNLSVMPNSAAISPKPKALGSNSNTVYLPSHQPSPLRLQVDQIASKTLLPPKQNRPAP